APLKIPQEALDIVRYHHERLDGRGYPAGLKQPDIPLAVAIVSVADAFDAMTGYRPYRQTPMAFEDALAELHRCAGTQFRADAVDALAAVLQEEGKVKAGSDPVS
ncbi:MAG: HD domain-containing protein, partial [Candidatus Omnitrophica bacterium]|nr:HD domain-containing protein [Candidatus Omnitrophota bacterium]